MNQNFPQSDSQPTDAERTLRLLANLPPPEGLADRVHRHLKSAPRTRRSWFSSPFAMNVSPMRLRFAGAVLVVAAMAGGGWTLLHRSNHAQAVTPLPQSTNSTGFRNAGAVRVPPTLKPLHVAPAPKKKPSASHAASKPVVKASDSQEATPAANQP